MAWPLTHRPLPLGAHRRYIPSGPGLLSVGLGDRLDPTYSDTAWPPLEGLMYSAKARSLRRCLAVRRDGQPCKAWAMWGVPGQRCISHAGVRPGRVASERTHAVPCRCAAYAWPHRAGGGWCHWPDPAIVHVAIPPGTHRYSAGTRRARSRWRRLFS
jgi:hypothetical protein